ncbi:DUF262 domain-containing protein [uncultured Amnibacterium sp.]|uniref:DUF262 domain-containing protein n=1 Tax=uncultured Amnibacterium sp. TaxID=1631851 RepID=UPI0035CAA576
MAFQTPVTVEEMLSGIHEKRYLLPAIQREFVWRPHQIRTLVDSLMRGYPIGSFLLWDVSPATAQHFQFYDFITNFHERDAPFATKAVVPTGHGVMAVLDGQQRLTSLNIAVYGSHAEKRARVWHTNPDAYPKRRLYLNLMDAPDHEELGLLYDLRFLADKDAQPVVGEPDRWFPVGDVLTLADAGPAMMLELTRRGITDIAEPFTRLYALFDAFRTKRPINWYLEKDQSADKVLDIFVRVNSGGTSLSYSDLLLSMATNQWTARDAREEVRDLVQEINHGASRDFAFSKDVVLKTALMVAGVNLAFRVGNFTRENMAEVEANWDRTERALLGSASLLASFGYTTQTLTADSVIIPIAYYLARSQHGTHYLESSAAAPDRKAVQRWVTRSLLKQGIWGSGLDTLLSRLRQAIDGAEPGVFPSESLEQELTTLGKSLRFDDTDIDELLRMKYGGQRTFTVLTLLYPGLDLSKQFHQDHVFPKSRFTEQRLRNAGIAADDVIAFRERFNSLPNLQLLGGTVNIEKQDKSPADWMQEAFVDTDQRRHYEHSNDLEGLPLDLAQFLSFYEQRRERMRTRLQQQLRQSARST